jgi:very-short-patch-repair endonuclease
MKIHYNPKLKTFARELRKQGVLSEVLLWDYLKGRKMKGYQCMRQKPIGEYIVDNYYTLRSLPQFHISVIPALVAFGAARGG